MRITIITSLWVPDSEYAEYEQNGRYLDLEREIAEGLRVHVGEWGDVEDIVVSALTDDQTEKAKPRPKRRKTK
jgi:hypothetical protein